MVRANRAEEIFSYIKRQILSGEWKEGERINDALLAKELGVSRTSVREALFRLVETGVVSKEYWKGYFICEVSDEMVAEIIQIRVALESCGIRNFVSEATPELLDKLQQIIEDSRDSLERNELIDYLTKDYSFHETIYRSQHNRYIKSSLDNLQPVIHFIRIKSMGTDDDFVSAARSSIDWHQKILNAIKAGDAEHAVSTLVDHLEAHRSEAMHHISKRCITV